MVFPEEWGVKVERVEVKDVRIPPTMQRSMAAIAEAEREAKAKVIAAEGEQQASKALSEAAKIIQGQPAAMQLRYLQTLNTISAEHNSTIVFPFPIDLMHTFMSVVHPDHQRKVNRSPFYNQKTLLARLESLEQHFEDLKFDGSFNFVGNSSKIIMESSNKARLAVV